MGESDVIIGFIVHKPIHLIRLREAIDRSASMLENSTKEIVGMVNIERSVAFTGEYVDIVGHEFLLVPRVKPEEGSGIIFAVLGLDPRTQMTSSPVSDA